MTQAITLKLDIHTPRHKKIPSAYTILFGERPHFPDAMIFFYFRDWFQKSGYYLKCNKESQLLQGFSDASRWRSALNIYSGVFEVNNKQFVKHDGATNEHSRMAPTRSFW